MSMHPGQNDSLAGGSPPRAAAGAGAGQEAEGGEPACWAHLVCPECGAITTEGHRPGCGLAPRHGHEGLIQAQVKPALAGRPSRGQPAERQHKFSEH